MAKQDQQMQQKESWVDASVRERMSEFDRRMEEEERKKNMQESKDRLESKINLLKEKAKECYLEYGADDWRTAMMMDFLDAVLEMQNEMKQIESIMVVMDCVGEMTGYIEQAVQFHGMLQNQNIQQKHGFFQRIANKIRNRRMVKNSYNRIRTLTDNVSAMMETVQDMGEAFHNMSEDLKRQRYKMAIRRQKAEEKRKKRGSAPEVPGSSRARAMIEGIIREEKGGASAPTAPVAPTAPTPSVDGASGTDSIDDIV